MYSDIISEIISVVCFQENVCLEDWAKKTLNSCVSVDL